MLQMMATHPINSMRNMAMLLARTELIMPLDVDLVLSRDLSDIVRSPERYGRGSITFVVRRCARARNSCAFALAGCWRSRCNAALELQVSVVLDVRLYSSYCLRLHYMAANDCCVGTRRFWPWRRRGMRSSCHPSALRMTRWLATLLLVRRAPPLKCLLIAILRDLFRGPATSLCGHFATHARCHDPRLSYANCSEASVLDISTIAGMIVHPP